MKQTNILLVEDEESLASFIQTELEFEGYKVIW
ncbi:MAG: response regulator transcription factor, partial [Vagococcus fluvialis]